jgi:hypothetical protein
MLLLAAETASDRPIRQPEQTEFGVEPFLFFSFLFFSFLVGADDDSDTDNIFDRRNEKLDLSKEEMGRRRTLSSSSLCLCSLDM